MDLGLRGRVFLVTGGSRGLGLAAATVLVTEGACVVVSGRDGDVAAAAARQLGGASRAVGVAADNADPEAPKRLIGAALDAFGRLDGGLMSGAGPASGALRSMTDEAWRASFDAVFLGPLRISRMVAESAENGGSMAFVLSTTVRSPIPGLAVSSGLRSGLAMVVKMLADELGPRGIRVNGLLPGRTRTEGLRALDAEFGEEQVAARRAAIPLGRDGTPEEFGRVAAFVLSPAASYVTGAMIPVDGGALRTL